MEISTNINRLSSVKFNQNQIIRIAQNKEFVELVTAFYWFDVPNSICINLLRGNISLEECCKGHTWLYKVLYHKKTLFEEKILISGSRLYLESNLRKDLKEVFPFIKNKCCINTKEVTLLLSKLLSSKLSIKVTPENIYKVCHINRVELLNLSNIDLSHTNLSGLDFSGFNFQGTKFDGATLRGTNFTKSNLNLATFNKADLTRTNFTGANLSHTNLSQAIIYLTIFYEATFRWAKFTLPNQGHTPKVIWHGGDLRKADCTGTDFRNVVFKNCQKIALSGDARYNFSYKTYSQLTRCLTETNFTYANFGGLDLSSIDFSGSNLSYADLNDTNLQGTVLTNAILKGATLKGADITHAAPINLIILNAYILHWLVFKHTNLLYYDVFKGIFMTLIQLSIRIPQPNVIVYPKDS